MALQTTVAATVEAIGALDAQAMARARERLDRLTKPPGSLGRLEELAIWLAGVTGQVQPSFPRRRVVVAAADHGVAAGGVSAYPPSVTAQMVTNFLRGGAAINALARTQGAEVTIVDAGVLDAIDDRDLAPVAGTTFLSRRIAEGTMDMRLGPAMSREEAQRAVEAGIAVVEEQRIAGLDLIATGDMGIGNSTAAAAVTAAITRVAPAEAVGRGTGVDEAGLARKREAVARALAVNRPDPGDGLDVLAKVGGLEIGVLTGVILGAAAGRVPVVLDGFISGAAALVAQQIAPTAIPFCIAAHRSTEPGHAIALDTLTLDPYLDLQMRLGEGTGAALAFALVDAAAAIMSEMATFEEAGVSDREPECRSGGHDREARR